MLAGRSLLRRSLDVCLHISGLGQVVVVAPDTHLGEARRLLAPGEHDLVDIVRGGVERRESVRAGLAALRDDIDLVLVHDAARALAPAGLFDRVVEALRSGHDAVVPGVAVTDTIKRVDDTGRVVETPPRSALRAIQTPQGFRRDVLQRAHDRAGEVTDDAGLVEAIGEPVHVVDGDPRAHKVTTPADLEAARRLLAEAQAADPAGTAG